MTGVQTCALPISKIMAIADRGGLPVAVCIESASPHEVKLVEKTLDHRFIDEQPKKLIGDKAYDSDPLDDKLKTERNIEMIVPHRLVRNRKRLQLRMVAPYVAIVEGGKSRGSLPGSKTSAAW